MIRGRIHVDDAFFVLINITSLSGSLAASRVRIRVDRCINGIQADRMNPPSLTACMASGIEICKLTHVNADSDSSGYLVVENGGEE